MYPEAFCNLSPCVHVGVWVWVSVWVWVHTHVCACMCMCSCTYHVAIKACPHYTKTDPHQMRIESILTACVYDLVQSQFDPSNTAHHNPKPVIQYHVIIMFTDTRSTVSMSLSALFRFGSLKLRISSYLPSCTSG